MRSLARSRTVQSEYYPELSLANHNYQAPFTPAVSSAKKLSAPDSLSAPAPCRFAPNSSSRRRCVCRLIVFISCRGGNCTPAPAANLTPGLLRQMKISPRVAARQVYTYARTQNSPSDRVTWTKPVPFNKSLVFSIALHISRASVNWSAYEFSLSPTNFLALSVFLPRQTDERGKLFLSLQHHNRVRAFHDNFGAGNDFPTNFKTRGTRVETEWRCEEIDFLLSITAMR